jgi:hypothetical protein
MRKLVVFTAVLALTLLVAAGPAVADAGSHFHSRITCSGYYTVYIYSSAENWVDYYWDSGHEDLWNPYANFWGYNTGDPSTWAVIEWDQNNVKADGRYCRSPL